MGGGGGERFFIFRHFFRCKLHGTGANRANQSIRESICSKKREKKERERERKRARTGMIEGREVKLRTKENVKRVEL